MTDIINMPEIEELKEELNTAKSDIQEAVKEDPSLANQSEFVLEILDILQEKVSKFKDLNKLDRKDQISVIAHLNLFYSLVDDIFGNDYEDFDDEAFELDDEETEEEDEDEK